MIVRRHNPDVDRLSVPRDAVKVRVADPARRGFRSERHLDAVGPVNVVRMDPVAVGIDSELPCAVQRGPVTALKLGTRISMTSGTLRNSAALVWHVAT